MDFSPLLLPRILDASEPRRAHLVGIAGSGMWALADVLLGWGWSISGSDLDIAALTCFGGADIPACRGATADCGRQECLPQQRLQVFQGHDAGHLPRETDLVVYSSAVPPTNPEISRAAELGIPTMSYCQMLGQVGLGRRSVAIAGTHGKSTVTAMLAHLLTEAGLDPTVVCGATTIGAASGGRAGEETGVRGQGAGARGQGPAVAGQSAVGCEEGGEERGEGRGKAAALPPSALRPPPSALRPSPSAVAIPFGARLNRAIPPNPLFVVEACEYRANFLNLRPWQAAITGIEPDHFDCYDSLDELESAFRRFAELVAGEGLLIARHDCPSTRRAAAAASCRVESFGISADADWSASVLAEDHGRCRCEIRRFGRRFCQVEVPMPGEHNVLNALAAAALAAANGLSPSQISTGLESFPGLHRRLESLGQWRGVRLIDDYAHHPTEVAAALATVRRMVAGARLWCVFQPHQASRTARLFDRFAAALQNADKLLVADIFRAREAGPQPGEVTAADLARRAAELGVDVLPAHAPREIVETLKTQLAPGDVLVTLGAGDTWRLRPGEMTKSE